jgi:hypothetical protein
MSQSNSSEPKLPLRSYEDAELADMVNTGRLLLEQAKSTEDFDAARKQINRVTRVLVYTGHSHLAGIVIKRMDLMFKRKFKT